jgi:hypothetical protein
VHNERIYDFFGISDYGGEILYDGWIYFGESSRIAITDADSPAVRAINAVYRSDSTDGSNIPTGWEIYYSLLRHGYTSEQAFSLLQQASLDSIRKDVSVTWRILMIKLREGFEPHTFIPGTFALPGERTPELAMNADYFNEESAMIPLLISLQRFVNSLLREWYPSIFTVWFWLGLTMIFISLYRRPSFRWLLLSLIAINSIFLPTIIGASMWRYVLFGLVLMPIFIMAGIQSIGEFIPLYLKASGIRKS